MVKINYTYGRGHGKNFAFKPVHELTQEEKEKIIEKGNLSIKSKLAIATTLLAFKNEDKVYVDEMVSQLKHLYKDEYTTKVILRRIYTGRYGYGSFVTTHNLFRLFREEIYDKKLKKKVFRGAGNRFMPGGKYFIKLTMRGKKFLERGTADLYYDTIMNTPKYRNKL